MTIPHELTSADYALIVSILSVLIAIGSLLWNVWQKYIFVKPQVQVSFGTYQSWSPRDRRAR
jgi:hypothetical protein